MILAEELKRVYKKLDKVISIEDNLKEFIEEYNKYAESTVKKIEAVSVKLLVNKSIEYFLNPENVSVAIRLPLELRWDNYATKPTFSGYNNKGYPIYQIQYPFSYNNFWQSDGYKINKQINSDKIQQFNALANKEKSEIYSSTIKKSLEDKKQEFKDLMIERIKESGIKYSISKSKNGRGEWLLLDINKTKPDMVSKDFKEIYNSLKETFY